MRERDATFSESLGRLLPRLRRFAHALTRNPHDADDLVQVAIERALERQAQWRPDSSVVNWVLAILRNAWIDEQRRRGRQGAVIVAEEALMEVGDSGTDGDIELWSIQQALEQLPSEQRLSAALVLLEGLSYREAALVMGVPLGTLMSRLARARLALQALLSQSPKPAAGHKESR